MDHCSIVCSIIRHAVAGNVSQVRDYAGLLAEKLREDGKGRLVSMIEQSASDLPSEHTVIAGQKPMVPVEVLGGFPKLPEYQGTWWPVYWTPIAGSGERITAFVVAVGGDGQWCVREAIREAALAGMLGDQAPGVRRMHKLVLASIEAHLTSGGDFIQWKSPLTGFSRGSTRPTLADNIRQIAAQGIRYEAPFAVQAFADLNQE